MTSIPLDYPYICRVIAGHVSSEAHALLQAEADGRQVDLFRHLGQIQGLRLAMSLLPLTEVGDIGPSLLTFYDWATGNLLGKGLADDLESYKVMRESRPYFEQALYRY
jgi:hypothetical protein